MTSTSPTVIRPEAAEQTCKHDKLVLFICTSAWLPLEPVQQPKPLLWTGPWTGSSSISDQHPNLPAWTSGPDT